MQRDKDIIIFSPDEQKQFPKYELLETMPAVQAVEFAEELNRQAAAMVDISTQRMTYCAGDRQVINQEQKNLAYAGLLGGFATKIFDLCPDEHLDLIAKNSPKKQG